MKTVIACAGAAVLMFVAIVLLALGITQGLDGITTHCHAHTCTVVAPHEVNAYSCFIGAAVLFSLGVALASSQLLKHLVMSEIKR